MPSPSSSVTSLSGLRYRHSVNANVTAHVPALHQAESLNVRYLCKACTEVQLGTGGCVMLFSTAVAPPSSVAGTPAQASLPRAQSSKATDDEADSGSPFVTTSRLLKRCALLTSNYCPKRRLLSKGQSLRRLSATQAHAS